MADKLPEKDTSRIETKSIANEIDVMVKLASSTRKYFARNWYNNNFFDDGYHLRSISRTTGRIVDLSNRATLYSPRRNIPKTSRQIRGMVNLMLSQDYVPQVRPENVTSVNYPDPQEFQQARLDAKNVARRSGHWLTEEWKVQDLDIKLAQMLLLTMKNFISYIKIWPDPVEEAIKTTVRDAFDVYLMSNYTSIYDSPFIVEAAPKLISQIKANELFDKGQLKRLQPDTRYASDEIKEAYLISKFGKSGSGAENANTVIQYEAFIKEILNDKNIDKVRKSPDGEKILKDKEKGDPVIRHVFSTSKVWLLDEYVDLPDYPLVDLRLEPGPIYGVAPIERFISLNKSYDSVMSRIERWLHTMNVGVWTKRKGESFDISNVAGGLVATYDKVPPGQMQTASMTAGPFNFAQMLETNIEEQGVTTSALGKLPKGVKAGIAIESLKASEFANLYIAIKQIKDTIKRISEKMFDIADKHFINRQTIMRLDKGEPDYFDIVGQAGVDARKDIEEADTLEDVTPIRKDYKVDIQIESGLGYTDEGKKARMMEIATFMLGLAKEGLVPPEGIKAVIQRLFEVFSFGPTAELMEAMEQVGTKDQMTENQIQQVKIAVLEVLRDAKKGGFFEPDEKKGIEIAKVGTLETLKDAKRAGLFDKDKPDLGGSREVQQTESRETGKDGTKTKQETKVITKTE
jgi:hypothetical protein